MDVQLTEPQTEFFNLKCPFPLFTAGFGTGKSFVLIVSALRDILMYRGANIWIYSPTFDLNRLNLEPRILEMLDEMGELIEITFSGELARQGENLTAYPDLTISKNRV